MDCDEAKNCTYPTPLKKTCEEASCVIGATTRAPNASAVHPEGLVASMEMFTDDCAGDRSFQLDQECYGWSRTVDEETASRWQPYETFRPNSAACFQCYRGDDGFAALCFREYQYTLSCDQPDANGLKAQRTTDKLFTTERCQNDGGDSYTRLTGISGDDHTCKPMPTDMTLEEACEEWLASEDCTHTTCGSDGLDCGHEVKLEANEPVTTD
ncbi:MAG: hypothetical protein ACI8RZ_003620 [Myxococcota bacterium]